MGDPAWLIRASAVSDWAALRALRLEALRTAPAAFGSSLERELAFTDDVWRERSAGGSMVLGWPLGPDPVEDAPSEGPVGMAGGILEPGRSDQHLSDRHPSDRHPSDRHPSDHRSSDRPRFVQLVAMYVRPGVRGRGLADELIEAVIGSARARGAGMVRLWVAESNPRAERVYARHAFVRDGATQPHSAVPGEREYRMCRPL